MESPVSEPLSYEAVTILNAIRETAQITREMHQRNEGRLAEMEMELRRHTGILDRYLVKQEAIQKVLDEFSGANSLYVQFGDFRSELKTAKAQVSAFEAQVNAVKQEYTQKMREMTERREQEMRQMEERRAHQEELDTKREEAEAQRQREHEKNQYGMWMALIAGGFSVLKMLVDFLKK